MSCYVVGVKCFKSKKGSDLSIIFFTQPFSKYEVDSADFIVGETVGQEMIPGVFSDLNVGDEIEFVYRKSFSGQAFCDGYNLVSTSVKE